MQNSVTIKKDYAKKIRDGYPWVFLDHVATPSVIATSSPGELVKVADNKGQFLGAGYTDPKSKICIRILGTNINKLNFEFFYQRMQKALQKREKATQSKYYRLINSEGDYLPGLTIDRFNDVFSCQITTQGMFTYKAIIIEVLKKLFEPQSIIIRSTENDVPEVIGKATDEIIVEEYGVKFYANLITGQKTGWYFDQRENRSIVAKLCQGKDVLDIFCYNGGFGICAAAHDAKSVTFIDSSKPALELAKKSLNLNTHHAHTAFIQSDAFDQLAKLKEQNFNVVVVDPPPFIPAKSHKASGLRGYYKLALASIPKVCASGLLFFASCSHHIDAYELKSLVLKAVNECKRNGKVLHVLGHAFDHPTHPKLPESKYLNAILLELK